VATEPEEETFEVEMIPFVSNDELPSSEELKELRSRNHVSNSDREDEEEEGNSIQVIIRQRMTEDGKIVVQPFITPNHHRKIVSRKVYSVPRNTSMEEITRNKDPNIRIRRYRDGKLIDSI